MAIFDSNKKMYLTYYVVLTDPALVDQYQQTYPDGANIAPYNPGPPAGGAAIQFNAPWRGYTQPAAGDAPFSWTPWSGQGEQDGPYPLNVASFQRHTGGFLGMGGTTVKYYWMGEFVLAGDSDATSQAGIPIEAKIPGRRLIEGFDYPGASGFVFPNTGGVHPSPDASRHAGGLGCALRGATTQVGCNYNVYGATNPSQVWERFYFRLRQLPSAATFFWNNSTTPSSSVGQLLAVTASGDLALYTSNSSGVKTLILTLDKTLFVRPIEVWDGTVDHDAWHRIDMIQQVGGTPKFCLFLDGKNVGAGDFAGGVITGTAGAVGGATAITSSGFGAVDGIDNGLYVDVDDWMVSDIPVLASDGVTLSLNSRDFINGTKIVRVSPLAFNAGHSGNWTGDVRVLRQMIANIGGVTPMLLTCATSGAQAAVDTDADLTVDADAGTMGAGAMKVVAVSNKSAAGVDAKLGFSLAGGADVLTTRTQGTTLSSQGVMWAGPAAMDFVDVTPLVLKHEKGADAVGDNLALLGAEVALVGKWTLADYHPLELQEFTDFPELPHTTGPHNYPYPRTPWSVTGQAAPIAPYIVKGGTYVGNGTGQDLTFRAPVHTLFIRPLTGGLGGYWHMSTCIGSHRITGDGITAQVILEEDPTFNGAPGEDSQTVQYRARIAGNHTQNNAVGVTYQYIAVMDPGMRYGHGATFAHRTTFGPRIWPLRDPGFTPEFAFIQAETGANTSAQKLYAKSSGQAAASIVSWAAAVVANALTFGVGQVTTDVGLHGAAGYASAMMLWRKHDGSNDTGEAGVVNYGSYIGDGSASRTVNLSPASGRRPLFAMVFPESGTPRWRDPSHTGSNSSSNLGTEAATGITSGGIDQFSVGSGLNTNAVVFTYFVLYADATAGNNGWGVNGEYAPVEPTAPTSPGLWGPEPPEPGTVPPPDVPPGIIPDPDDPTPDFGVECVGATTVLVNRALSRIGISKQLANVSTDSSLEAASARLHWGGDVNQVLRDYPWSFATRYADLVLVAGTSTVPVNKDWQYAYRAPADMLFARRIVGQAGQQRQWDPDPIKFRLGADGGGALIYTNAYISTDVPVQLEYTIRVDCPATKGDPIFRSALAWRHAMSLAPSLTRDPKKVETCELMYQRTINDARRADAQEQQQAPDGDAPWITGRA